MLGLRIEESFVESSTRSSFRLNNRYGPTMGLVSWMFCQNNDPAIDIHYTSILTPLNIMRYLYQYINNVTLHSIAHHYLNAHTHTLIIIHILYIRTLKGKRKRWCILLPESISPGRSALMGQSTGSRCVIC